MYSETVLGANMAVSRFAIAPPRRHQQYQHQQPHCFARDLIGAELLLQVEAGYLENLFLIFRILCLRGQFSSTRNIEKIDVPSAWHVRMKVLPLSLPKDMRPLLLRKCYEHMTPEK
jgi:hypothetical protein